LSEQPANMSAAKGANQSSRVAMKDLRSKSIENRVDASSAWRR
jgi:hypothetical protein